MYIYTKFQIEHWNECSNLQVSSPQNHLSGHAQTCPRSYLPAVSDALHDEIGPKAVGTTGFTSPSFPKTRFPNNVSRHDFK